MCLYALAAASAVLAGGIFVPAVDRVDMVMDTARGLLYITSANAILRYDARGGSFLPPIVAPEGAHLMGIDLSPDCSALVVADGADLGEEVRVFVVNLQTETVSEQRFASAEEAGTFAVAFGQDGTAFITSGSRDGRKGTVPLRRYDPRSGRCALAVEGVPHCTMVSASADMAMVGFAGRRATDKPLGGGSLGLVSVATGTVARIETGFPLHDVALNADGTRLAVPVASGVRVYDQALTEVGDLPNAEKHAGLGVVYCPITPFVHISWRGGAALSVYDARRPASADAYVLPTRTEAAVATAFESGRLRISRDGSLLACTVDGGVWLEAVHATPWAHDQSLTTTAGTPVPVKLSADVTGGVPLTFEVGAAPEHGTLTGTMDDLSYVPDRGYVGPDHFTFRARNGEHRSAAATVAVTVEAGDRVATASPNAPTPTKAPGDGTTRCWALVYGCSEYGAAEEGKNLWLVPCNVAQVAGCFHNRMGIPWENMTVRVDEVDRTGDEITPELVKADIAGVASRADGDDIVAFYFCGHGDTYPQGGVNSERLCLSGGDLSDRELGAALAALPCACTIVVLDACYSGGFAISPDELTGECASLATGHTVYAIGSCERTRPATGYEFPHDWPWLGATLFTPLFCEAVDGGIPAWKRKQLRRLALGIPQSSDANADGVITLQEAFEYARDACQRISANMGLKQVPVMGPEIPRQVSDFVLSRPLPPEVLAADEPWLKIEIADTQARRTPEGAEVTLIGNVKDRQGRPAPGVRLMVNDSLVRGDRSSPGMLTDQNGRFWHRSAARGKPPGAIFYTFCCPGADPVLHLVNTKGF